MLARLSYFGQRPLVLFVCLLSVYLAVTILVKGTLLSAPRFWAEEGVLYFPRAQQDGWRVLLMVANGNFQLLTNLGVFLAAQVPLVLAPAVTTYFALLADLVAVALISVLVVQKRLRLLPALLLCVYWCLALPRYETGLNVTNVQWTCAFLTLLVLLQRPDMPRFWMIANAILILTCGLTGIPSMLLAPFFLAWALIERSKYHAVLGGLLSLCALLHLYILVQVGAEGRPFALSPEVLIGATSLQTVIAPLLGVGSANDFGALLRDQTGIAALTRAAALLAIAVAACVTLASRSIGPMRSGLLAALWLAVAAVQVLGALGDPTGLLSGIAGARYFLTSVMTATLLLALGASSTSRSISIISLLLLCNVNYLAWTQYGKMARIFLNGPDWRAQIETCVSDPCNVTVWPGGGWVLDVAPDALGS